MTLAPASSPVPSAGPFKFLEYFAEEEERTFFGRDRDILDVATQICRDRTFVLYGRSGFGKTSLLRAGVVPELRRRGFQTVTARIPGHPLEAACSALRAALGRPSLTTATAGTEFIDLVRALAEQGPSILILDQFEEFFTLNARGSDARKAFVESLAAALSDESLALRVVFSIREDFIALLDEFGPVLANLLKNSYRLQPLTAYGTRAVIVRTLDASHVLYDESSVERLVDYIGELGFDPSMLQIVCAEVLRRARERSPHGASIEAGDLPRDTGIHDIFRGYLDRVMQGVAPEDHLLTRLVLDALITKERTKRPLTLAGLMNCEFVAPEQDVSKLLSTLEVYHLVRKERRGEEDWFELVHDRLVQVVCEWLDLDGQFFEFRSARDLIVNLSRGKKWRVLSGALLHERQMRALVSPYKNRLRLTPTQSEFVFTSAVYWEDPDLEFWGDRLGGAVESTLHRLMDSDEASMRRGAVRASARMAKHFPGIVERVFGLAFHDVDPSVRRAAGCALAILAGPEQHGKLLEALRGAQRKAAREILADILGAGGSLRAGLWSMWRARRLVRRRRLAEAKERIAAAVSRARWSGILAALAWWLVVGVPMTLLTQWRTTPSVSVLASLLMISIVWPLALILNGWMLGWIFGRWAAVQGEVQGFDTILNWRPFVRMVLWPTAIAAAVMFFISLVYLRGDRDGLSMALFLVLGLLVIGLVLVSTRYVALLVQGAMGPRRDRRTLVVLSVLASSAWPVTLYELVLRFFRVSDKGLVSTLASLQGVWSFAWTLVSCAILVVLGQSAQPRIRRRTARWVIAGALLLTTITLASNVRRTSVPFLAPRVRVTAAETQVPAATEPPGQPWQKYSYHALEFSAPEDSLIGVTGSLILDFDEKFYPALVLGPDLPALPGAFLFVSGRPGSQSLLSASETESSGARLSVMPLRKMPDSPPAVASDAWAAFRVPLQSNTTGGEADPTFAVPAGMKGCVAFVAMELVDVVNSKSGLWTISSYEVGSTKMTLQDSTRALGPASTDDGPYQVLRLPERALYAVLDAGAARVHLEYETSLPPTASSVILAVRGVPP